MVEGHSGHWMAFFIGLAGSLINILKTGVSMLILTILIMILILVASEQYAARA